ncbi:MAG: flagellar export chaperone FliS [Betaproteobacteria bacterium]|nr:flagellar export chaperone FliS [Betaproteobacteria bacterium]
MFGNFQNPAASYASVSLETSVQTADPHYLIMLLFEGSRAAMIEARHHIEAGNIPEKGKALSKAIDIIANGLHASLNVEAGGDLAEKLGALYDYWVDRLLWANLHNDTAAIDEVLHLHEEIHSAWADISPGKTPLSSAP